MVGIGYARGMSESAALLFAADRLADRFRSMPQSRLAVLAPEGLLLARALAVRALELEGGPARPELPEVGIFAVGDQIALAAHDLAAVLTARNGPDQGADDASDAAVLAEALAGLAEVYRLATTRSARM